jgi:hypothetical protein
MAGFDLQHDLMVDQVKDRLRVGPEVGLLFEIVLDRDPLASPPRTALVGQQQGE